jgi:hypothetical protein
MSEFSKFNDDSSAKIFDREESKFLEKDEKDLSKASRPSARVCLEVSAWRN